MSANIMITGISRGIGRALAEHCLGRGDAVFGISRSSVNLTSPPGTLRTVQHDLSDLDGIKTQLFALLDGQRELDLLVLNAGILGPIRDMVDTPLSDIRQQMEVNTWANKTILDGLFNNGVRVRQVVGLSSGAAVSGSRGWGGYALYKATFLMMLKLYAAEIPDTHFCSLAPGLVDTSMQDYLCGLEASYGAKFPTVARIQSARGTDGMPSPEQLAPRLLDKIGELLKEPSGSFIDIRH